MPKATMWVRCSQHRGRFLGVLLIVLLLVSTRPFISAGSPNRLTVRATSIVLIDGRTGEVLFSRSPHFRWPPASTTKMLTALLVVEALPDDKVVTISQRASRAREGRAIGLEVGEQWRVGDLLKVMMVFSANDAAVALAEAVAGSVEEFAGLMNAKAIALGARESHFVDPHGLENPGHYSTAYDLAIIARAALQQPRIADVVRLRTWELIRHGRRPLLLVNSNRLLWRYPYADGVKTGWVPQSGHNLVASATRDGRKLIAVILDDQRPFTDAAALLDYGYTHYKLAQAGQIAAPLPTTDSQSSALTAVVAVQASAAVSQSAEPDIPFPSFWMRFRSWITKTFEQWS